MSLLVEIKVFCNPPKTQLQFHCTKGQRYVVIWYTKIPTQYHNSYETSETPSIYKIVYTFQTDGKTAHAAQCAKSKSLTKFIFLVIYIKSFEKKYVIFKVILK